MLGSLISILIVAILFCACYIEYNSDFKTFTLYELSHFDGVEMVEKLVEEQKAFDEETSQAKRTKMEQLAINLKVAMEEKHLYRDDKLTIISLSDYLNTNRTTLSWVIKNFYELDYRTYIANYRVEAAKSYMLSHPRATQIEIASECGFSEPSAFNRKFKEVVGTTPRLWLTEYNSGVSEINK